MQSGDQASGRDAMETDADGFRIDHRSETEQSGRTKEVHEYADRTEFRLRDEKEVRLEEVRTRETTRPATYDEILALLEAQFDGLEEIESGGGGSREVTVVEMNRRETARERAAAGGERTREITITDEKRREEIVEGPRESKRQVVTERETTVVNPRGGELRLLREEISPPMASIDIALIEPPPTPRDQQERLNFGAAAVGGTPPGSVDFRLGGTPQEVPRPSSEARYSLNVPSAADYYPAAAEGTGSLHRIQHRKHLIEELIVEDIDTFYEDQTKPPKKKRPLLKRKDKPETIETPPATLGRPSRPASTRPDGEEGHRGQEVLTLQGSAGQASLPQTAVAYPSYPHSNLGVGGMGDRPRSTTVGGNDDNRADDNSVTFVVSYDHPFGAKRAERRKKDVHPNKKKKEKKKEKLRSGRGDHLPTATDVYDRPGQSITYIVNYEPSRPFDAEPTEYVPRPGAAAAARMAEVPVPKDDSRRTSENLTIEVDMSAGDVKVSEPPTKHTETRTFSASYELPDRSVVAAAPSKIRYEPPRHPPPHPPSSSSPTDPANYRLSQNQGMTYVVNYDLPKRLPSRIESELEGSSAPTYSVTVGGDEPETKPVKEKKPKATKNDPYEITYVVDYGAGGRGDVTTDDDRVKGQPVRPGGESAEVRFRSPTVKGRDGAVPETITYVAEHEIETRGRGTLPKSTNVASPGERNDSTHTYIVNYELPHVQGERPHKKRGKGSRPDVEPEPVELTKWSDLPDSSSELKFSVHHEAPEIAAKFKEPVSKKTSVPSAKPKDLPGDELVFKVDHSLPKPKEQSSEFSTEADLPFPDVGQTFTEQSQELVFKVDYPWPEPVPEHHPTPRESPEFQETSEELVFNVDYPLPEPRTKPVELEPISRLSFEVEHPIPKRDVPEPDEDLVFEVDYPEPEPVIKPEESISGLAITVEHPFPKRRSEIEDASHEFSISIETPSKESKQKPDIYNSHISADFPSSITKPELELPKHAEEYSITVEHSLPKPHAAEHAVETKGQKLPVLPVPPSGDSVTYVVTYEEPTLARQQEAAKEKKKHGKRTTKNKESLSAAVNDTSPEAGETITYIVNYNEPSTGLDESDGFDSMPTKERQVGQPAKYSGRQTQDEQRESRKAVQPPPGSITYTVDYGVIPAGKAPRGKTKREGPSDIERLEAEIRHETPPPIAAPDLTITVGHPEYNLTRQQESTTDSLTYIVNHDQPFNVGKTKKAKPPTETQTYTFIVNTAEPSIPVQPTSTSVAAHSQNIHAQTPEGEMASYDISVSRPEPVTIASSSTPKDFNKHAQEQLTFIVNHDLPSRVRLEAAKNEDFHQLETSQIKQIDQQASIKFDESDIGRFKAGTNIAAEESITYIVKSDESTGQVITDKDYRATKETLKSSHIVAPNIATGVPESVTFIVNHDRPKLSASTERLELTTTVSKAKGIQLPQVRSSHIAADSQVSIAKPDVDQNLDDSFKAEAPKIPDADYISQLTIAVERPEIKPQSEEIRVEVRKPEIIIPPPKVDLPKRGAAESMTYVVNYDDQSKPPKKAKLNTKTEKIHKDKKAKATIPTPEINAAAEARGAESMTYIVNYDVPERKAKFEEPQIVPTGEIITPAIKPVEPKVKIEKQFEELVIAVEHPEISPEKPEAEISYQEQSSQLTITVEQPEIKPQTEEISVKIKKPEIIIPSAEVELPKRGAAEAITYVVTYDDESLVVPKKAKVKTKTEKVLKDIKSKVNIPTPELNAAAETLGAESMTYIVNYDVPGREAKFEEPQIALTSIKPVEPKVKIEKQFEELVITVEHPELSREKPEAEISYQEPSSQLTITVEQPEIKPQTEEISVKVKMPEIIIPSPHVELPGPQAAESMTYVVDYDVPKIEEAKVPEIELVMPVEQLAISVESHIGIHEDVEPSNEKESPFSFKVERPQFEVTDEVNPESHEIALDVREPELVVSPPSLKQPKRSAAETLTYIVNYEEPLILVSKKSKPKTDKEKKLKVSAAAGDAPRSTGSPAGESGIVTPTTRVPVTAPDTGIAADASLPGEAYTKSESMTYVVEHLEEPKVKESISAEGEKKRIDWIWRVKKPGERIDLSIESKERESPRAEELSSVKVSTETPALGTVDSDALKAPESLTYVVTYDVPSSKPTAKRLPFSIKPRPVKIKKITPDKKKTGLFVKKDLPQATGKVDIELQEVEQKGEEAKEAPREDIRISIPTVPSVNVGLEPKETVSVEESDVLTLPVVPAFTADVTVAEPSVEVVVPPVETEEKELKPEPEEEDAKISRKETLQFDVEAKLPGRKEQAFAEKLIGTKLKAADKDAVEKSQYQDRLIITVEEQQVEEHPAEEEIVTYIVNYDQPSIGGSPTKPKDEAKKKETPSKPTPVPTEAEKHQATTDAYLEAQLPQQLEQCILVPLHQESSPEDSFYSAATEDESPTPTPTPTPRDRQRRRHFDNNNDDDYEEEEGEYYDDTESDLSSQKLAAADTRWAPSPTESDRLLPPHLVVVAIDFGTTFSGYAFSFARDATGGIHVMRKWEGGDPGAVDYKTPTILLLTPDRRFHSFGFTARDFYHDLSPKESARWLYFEKFKMALHFCEKLHPSTQLAAANGEGVAAIDIFSHSLRFFRDHVLQEVSDQVSTDVLNEDIYWIITVPAIWTDEAKQFMRLAAYKAGIASPDYPDQLLIALEPEAASIYVRKQRLHQLVPEAPLQRRRSYQRRSVTPEPTAVNQPIGTPERKTHPSDGVHVVKTTTVSVNWTAKTTIPQTEVTVGHQVDTTGTRYMVVDCGGGTVDITVHEIQSRDGTLREVHRATGGPFGSVAVDQEFEKLLVEIFGSDFIEVFKAKRPAGWVDLLMAFESRKRAANPHHVKPLNVSLPFSFIDYHKKYRNCPVEYAIRKYGSRDVRWSSQGMLRLMPDAMNRLFLPAIEKIKEAIGVALNDSGIRGLRFLFLVGGFAESPMLQLAIRQEFGHLMKIIIPNDASISILKGAVCFGLDPTVVTTRKSRMTYGVGVLNRFVRGQHPASKLVVKDGEDWCTDVFDALVYADQSVAIGDTVVRRYTLVPGGDQDAAAASVSKTVSVYSSETKDVRYVTDRGVTRCGTLELWGDGDEGGGASREEVRGREVQVRMIFGHTEIKVIAVDVRTRKTVRATIDFLNK